MSDEFLYNLFIHCLKYFINEDSEGSAVPLALISFSTALVVMYNVLSNGKSAIFGVVSNDNTSTFLAKV